MQLYQQIWNQVRRYTSLSGDVTCIIMYSTRPHKTALRKSFRKKEYDTQSGSKTILLSLGGGIPFDTHDN